MKAMPEPNSIRAFRATAFFIVLWGTLAFGFVARGQAVTRESVLQSLAQDVLAAGYSDLATNCQALTNAVASLACLPDQSTLDKARHAWAAAAASANRVRWIQFGPIVDREWAADFYYSRISPPAIEGWIQSSNAVDLNAIAGLAGDAKGLFGLEYLLFGHKGYPGIDAPNAARALELLSGKDSQRRRQYLLSAACELEHKATRLAEDWAASGNHGTAGKFVAGGQASVNLLVNHLAHAIEDVGANHLHFDLALPFPVVRQLYRIEGGASGASLANVLAYLEGAEGIYKGASGPGLAQILKQVNAPLADRVQQQFDAAVDATKQIGEPLDQAVVDKRAAIENAVDKTHALELLVKVDLASALGVTITFTSGDGD
jgi:hypothetical protein